MSLKIDQFNSYLKADLRGSASALFFEIADAFLRSLYPVSPPGKPSPKYLVHYTSLDTLFSMLDPKSPDYLRLYDTIHTNDPTEGVFFREHLQSAAPSIFARLPFTILQPDPGYTYISSFVRAYKLREADKLVYWLAYGRKGYGCSIAVPFPDFSPDLPILPVQYGKTAVKTAGEKLVSFLSQFPTDTRAPASPFSSLFRVFSSIPYFHKPNSYSYESECRLLLSPLDLQGEPVFELRSSSAGSPSVRHYVRKAGLQLSGILFTGTVITLGPAISSPENIQRAICALLRHHRLSGPSVVYSKIPYRAS